MVSAKVSYLVTTYYKRPRGEAGMTSAQSVRLDIGAALGWILRDLPGEALTMTFEGDDGNGARKSTIVIDWDKVPTGVKDGLS